MAITEEERKLIKAYNIGYALSVYEPRLLEQIIKGNKNNEFVKTMKIARDHQEFDRGIPRKDFSLEYKNGFNNARALSQYNPQLLDRLLSTDTLHKDYLKGLESGRMEHQIKKVSNQFKETPKPVPPEHKNDFKKGFNEGYRLSQYYPDVIKLSIDAQKRWAPYIQGLQAGHKQYLIDVQKGFTPTKIHELPDSDYNKTRNKIENLKENSEEKIDILNEPEKIDVKPKIDDDLLINYLPPWLKEVPLENKGDQSPGEEKEKPKDDMEPEI